MNDYLAKPINRDILRGKLAEWITRPQPVRDSG
jgi:hypothetical protein